MESSKSTTKLDSVCIKFEAVQNLQVKWAYIVRKSEM